MHWNHTHLMYLLQCSELPEHIRFIQQQLPVRRRLLRQRYRHVVPCKLHNQTDGTFVSHLLHPVTDDQAVTHLITRNF